MSEGAGTKPGPPAARARRRVEGWAVSAFEEREGPRRPRRARPVRNSQSHIEAKS